MTMTNQDFQIWAGETKQLIVTVTDGNGIIVDISGSQITWRLLDKNNYTIMTKTLGNGVTLTDPTHGIFMIQLNPTDTANLGISRYSHTAKITDLFGNVSVLLVGSITLNP